MPKKLLFAPPFPSILFSGEKTKTFRVSGGERYNLGDFLSLCDEKGEEFTRAVVSNKNRKTFQELTDSDWQGHERFNSHEEMYKTYSNWQKFQVKPSTSLDIIEYKAFRITNESLVKQLVSK